MDELTQLDGGAWRRSFAKADGRMLHLYGWQPHEAEPLAQEVDELSRGAQLRFHPLRGEWNIYAAHRQDRTHKPAAAANPLAPSRPGGMPTEIPFENFELAVFDNKFAALHRQASDTPDLQGIEAEPARGACEVVVYAPESEGNLHTIGQDRRRLLVAAWIDRYAALFDAGCAYVLPFENRGEEVGATLHHPHGQIYGFGKVPLVQQRAVDAFAAGYDLGGEIAAAAPDYGIAEAGGIAAWCPRYARFPYEVWLAPKPARQGPWDMSAEERDGLATLLGEVTRRYDKLFGRATPLMMGLHAAPAGGATGYHFTVQFYPLLRDATRVKYLASVEQHSGVFTVDVMPETAARALRDA